MKSNDVDADLVARAQKGDKRAFDLLVLKYQRRIMRLLGRMARDVDEREELAQETFVKAYRAIKQCRGDRAFHTWLYRMAINPARTCQSRQYRHPRNVGPFENEDGETFDQVENLTDISTPESILFSKQVAQTIQDTLKGLPDELRTALELREVEGMTYEEIAQAMGCPIGTVRSRIFRARE